MWSEVFAFIAGGAIAVTTLWNAIGRAHRRRVDEVVTLAGQQIKDLEVCVFAADQKNREIEQRFEAELKEEKRQREAAEKKVAEYFGTIAEIEKERNVWSTRYQAMGISYGNAQDLMITTIDKLCRQVERLGKKAEVPGVIRAVREEFFETHVNPHAKKEVEKQTLGT